MLNRTIILLLFTATRLVAGSASDIAKAAFASTVLVVTEDSHGQPLMLGSGFVLRDGAIVTNMHVIEGASRAYVKQMDSKTKHDVEGILSADQRHDLAVLSVPSLSAAAVKLGDSSKVAVGDTVYAVGNPQGLEGTFSQGIISSIRTLFNSDKFLQITAPISPGSSGGHVLNEQGEVIGVAVATFEGGQNLNFAIPSAYLSGAPLAAKPASFGSAVSKAPLAATPSSPLSEAPSDFVAQFVRDLATNDVEVQLRYYAERTNYYEFGRVGKAAISRDLHSDIRAWPNRTHSIRGTPKITSGSKGFTAQFPMVYRLTGTKGVSSGVLDITLEAELDGQTPQITEINKKVISARRPR